MSKAAETFGENVKKFGLVNTAFNSTGARIRVPKSTYGRARNGDPGLTIANAELVALAHGVELWQLFVEGFKQDSPPRIAPPPGSAPPTTAPDGAPASTDIAQLKAALKIVAEFFSRLDPEVAQDVAPDLVRLGARPAKWAEVADRLSAVHARASGESPESPGKARRANGK